MILERLFSAYRNSPAFWKIVFILGIGCHLAYVSNLKLGFLTPLSHDMTLFKTHQGIDFKAVYASGIYAREGINLYREGPVRGIEHTVFRYTPPVAIIIGAPLSFIPNAGIAYSVWILINEILFLIDLFLTIRFCKIEKRLLPALSLWLFFFPYAVEIYMGQFSFLTGSLLFWTLLALREKRIDLALCLWIPAILLKLFPAIFIPIFWKRTSPKKTLLALGAAFLFTMPYFLFHPHDLDGFLRLNFPFGGHPLTEPYFGNQGIYHFALAFRQNIPEISGAFLLFPIRAVGAAALLVFLYFCLKGQRSLPLIFSLGVSLFFLLSLEVWEHHYVMILPFFVLYCMTSQRMGTLSPLSFVLCAAPTLYLFVNPNGFLNRDSPSLSLNSSETFLYFAIKPVGVTIFMAILFLDLWKEKAAHYES
ncbi:DUF2029 domain-containing protein [Candidatus Sumerlaeota bacterium]|nr:DUF2029 domain-containing protein [Candidatus Sumerlaeota bacterium]